MHVAFLDCLKKVLSFYFPYIAYICPLVFFITFNVILDSCLRKDSHFFQCNLDKAKIEFVVCLYHRPFIPILTSLLL